MQVTYCNDGTYCCGATNTTCCSRGEGRRLASILEPISSVIPSAKRTSTTSRAATVTTSITAYRNKSSPGLDRKSTIGIALGCSVIFCIIASAIAFFILKRRRHAAPDVVRPADLTDSEVCFTSNSFILNIALVNIVAALHRNFHPGNAGA